MYVQRRRREDAQLLLSSARTGSDAALSRSIAPTRCRGLRLPLWSWPARHLQSATTEPLQPSSLCFCLKRPKTVRPPSSCQTTAAGHSRCQRRLCTAACLAACCCCCCCCCCGGGGGGNIQRDAIGSAPRSTSANLSQAARALHSAHWLRFLEDAHRQRLPASTATAPGSLCLSARRPSARLPTGRKNKLTSTLEK